MGIFPSRIKFLIIFGIFSNNPNRGVLSLSGGFTPCRHLRPSSGQEHTVIELIQSGDDDYLMNESRRKPTTLTQCPTLFDRMENERKSVYCLCEANLSVPSFTPQHTWLSHSKILIKLLGKGQTRHKSDPLWGIGVSSHGVPPPRPASGVLLQSQTWSSQWWLRGGLGAPQVAPIHGPPSGVARVAR